MLPNTRIAGPGPVRGMIPAEETHLARRTVYNYSKRETLRLDYPLADRWKGKGAKNVRTHHCDIFWLAGGIVRTIPHFFLGMVRYCARPGKGGGVGNWSERAFAKALAEYI